MRNLRMLILAAVLVGFLPGQALATWWYHSPECDPDAVGTGSTTIEDPIEPVNFFTITKTFSVFNANNCANPKPVNGSFTYVYDLENDANSLLPIFEYRIPIADASILVDYGYISGGTGVAPDSVSIVTEPGGTYVQFLWSAGLAPGEQSAPIFLVSPFQPGNITVLIEGGAALAGSGACIGPVDLPEPCPCGPLFWKLESLDWYWMVKYFPGDKFEQIKTRAVELSGGYFSDEGDLIAALFKWGLLDVKVKGEKELAAILLNLAAGDLYPGNTKCRLFLGTPLDLDGDEVADSTVDEALVEIIAGLQSGDWHLQLDAYHLAASINEGSVVVGAVAFH